MLWDKRTGDPVANAIVWQDRRTADFTQSLKNAREEDFIFEKTGLLADPYFSASKIKWLLDYCDLRNRPNLAFGTVESFLTFKLTAGAAHITDATNASRTSLLGLRDDTWAPDLLDLFQVPLDIMPEIVDNTGDFGSIAQGLPFSGVPITALIGDQQSAAIGQACYQLGQVKATYGTGCFILAPTEDKVVKSQNRLLTTIALQHGGRRTYALEGSIFNAGTVIQWFRDMLGIIDSSAESEALARSVSSSEGVYFVSAFTGLGAPHWNAEARGTITGLERSHTRAHLVRAGLESIVYQTCDLLEAIKKDMGLPISSMKVDGGMAHNRWFVEQLASFTQATVQLPSTVETTALGAAFLAGLGAGVFSEVSEIKDLWKQKALIRPELNQAKIERQMAGWHQALKHSL
ncbi:FGGY-family carbohydrate kinase [Temperatibacter marinus]|uniref:glycerol kinase n=1 Tax=Temperatibacter marinus TaxID=1456591 RepID=A0AA52EKZ8_9PROT|nr:FGGY-family carbohydrate kinase [Temperatibacter marinus]